MIEAHGCLKKNSLLAQRTLGRPFVLCFAVFLLPQVTDKEKKLVLLDAEFQALEDFARLQAENLRCQSTVQRYICRPRARLALLRQSCSCGGCFVDERNKVTTTIYN